MKKFYTMIPLQPIGNLEKVIYKPVDAEQLRYDRETSFPIFTAMNGYLKAEEPFEVVVVLGEDGGSKHNLEVFRQELDAFVASKGCVCNALHVVHMADDQRVNALLDIFRKLIVFADNNDELFMCMTFGTKTATYAMCLAYQYAYRLQKNNSMGCVVYGQIKRKQNTEGTSANGAPAILKDAYVYDVTPLLQMDEILRALADSGHENPAEVIAYILDV